MRVLALVLAVMWVMGVGKVVMGADISTEVERARVLQRLSDDANFGLAVN